MTNFSKESFHLLLPDWMTQCSGTDIFPQPTIWPKYSKYFLPQTHFVGLAVKPALFKALRMNIRLCNRYMLTEGFCIWGAVSDKMTPILPISISNVQYLYRTSNIDIRRSIWISDVQYLYRTSDIQYPTSARARARAGISDVRYRYRMSNIYIGRPDIYILDVLIYILDVRYKFRKDWWHFVLNGTSYLHSSNTDSIKRWNTDGALRNPKGVQTNSKLPDKCHLFPVSLGYNHLVITLG